MAKRVGAAPSPRFAPFLRRAEERSGRLALALREVARDPFPSAEGLHDLHRELRRAILDLELLAPALPRELRPGLARTQETLSELAKLCGAARDRDVGEVLLDALAEHGSWWEDRFVRRMRDRLRKEGRHQRGLLRRASRRALEEGHPHLPLPPWLLDDRTGVPRRFERAVRLREAEALRALAKRRGRIGRRPSAKDLHDLRVAARRVRSLRDALLGSPRKGTWPRGWKRLQQELGEHHDRSVLRTWVREQPPSDPRRRLDRALERDLEERGEKLRKRLAKGLPALRPL